MKLKWSRKSILLIMLSFFTVFGGALAPDKLAVTMIGLGANQPEDVE